MKLSLNSLLKNFSIGSPATSSEIAKAEEYFGYAFPVDYKEFLSLTNGMEGSLKDDYLVLWSTNELVELNIAYQVKDFVKDLIIFGSDGEEDAFAFDFANLQSFIVKLPFIGMGHIPTEKLADTFEEFLLPRIQNGSLISRLFG
jgi:hypothetical protein